MALTRDQQLKLFQVIIDCLKEMGKPSYRFSELEDKKNNIQEAMIVPLEGSDAPIVTIQIEEKE